MGRHRFLSRFDIVSRLVNAGQTEREFETSGGAEALADAALMKRALQLARRGVGLVSPNPAVGAVLARDTAILGQGWHRGPGLPHAEIEAIRSAIERGHSPRNSTLYVTLEPCSTVGRTPPCTEAIIRHGIRRVVFAAEDTNPKHAARSGAILREAGIRVCQGPLRAEAEALNPGFAHWIAHRQPLVTIKAAMTLDGKIASASGESKWITGTQARREGMRMRFRHDAVLVGINTVLADDPSLTVRRSSRLVEDHPQKRLRRFVLDSRARTPLTARLCVDRHAALTTIVVGLQAPKSRVDRLRKRVSVWQAPGGAGCGEPCRSSAFPSLKWLLARLGEEGITSLLVEGGGQVNASFLEAGLAHRIAFFYAPKILGGSDSKRSVGGSGWSDPAQFLPLADIQWKTAGEDLLLTASLSPRRGECSGRESQDAPPTQDEPSKWRQPKTAHVHRRH